MSATRIELLRHQVEIDRARLEASEAELEAAIAEQDAIDRAELKERIEQAEAPVPQGPFEEFYLTFGSGYRTSPDNEGFKQHPAYPDNVTGEGFVVIEARNESEARALAWVHFGEKFSSVYREDPRPNENNYSWYPLGEIGRMTADGTLTWRPTRG